MNQISRLFAAAVMIMMTSRVSSGADDILAGTWKINLQKSTYDPGPPARSFTMIVEPTAGGRKVLFEGIAANGSRISYGYTAKFDGKDYPVTGVGQPNGADSLILKRIDSNTTESTLKKAGAIVANTKITVSKGGKLATVTNHGTTPTGQPIHNVTVWDKQ